MPGQPPRFLYFDVGNVLLVFDPQRAASQMATVAEIPAEAVWQIVYETDLLLRHERGDLSSRGFYESFCELSGTRPDYEALCLASSDIFEINTPIVPIVAQLKAAGHRLGLLSNTNETHWGFVFDGRYTLLRNYFELYTLSHEVRSIKPEPQIFRAAIEMAQVAPNEIFFVDDREENVAAAREFGIDAVQFTGAGPLANELRSRGLRFNY